MWKSNNGNFITKTRYATRNPHQERIRLGGKPDFLSLLKDLAALEVAAIRAELSPRRLTTKWSTTRTAPRRKIDSGRAHDGSFTSRSRPSRTYTRKSHFIDPTGVFPPILVCFAITDQRRIVHPTRVNVSFSVTLELNWLRMGIASRQWLST